MFVNLGKTYERVLYNGGKNGNRKPNGVERAGGKKRADFGDTDGSVFGSGRVS